jgi:hypothetical protein
VLLSAELRTLYPAVEEIKNQQSAVVHSVQNQLTYMKELDEKVRQNTTDVSQLATTLRTLVYNVLNLNTTLTLVERNVTESRLS